MTFCLWRCFYLCPAMPKLLQSIFSGTPCMFSPPPPHSKKQWCNIIKKSYFVGWVKRGNIRKYMKKLPEKLEECWESEKFMKNITPAWASVIIYPCVGPVGEKGNVGSSREAAAQWPPPSPTEEFIQHTS